MAERTNDVSEGNNVTIPKVVHEALVSENSTLFNRTILNINCAVFGKSFEAKHMVRNYVLVQSLNKRVIRYFF